MLIVPENIEFNNLTIQNRKRSSQTSLQDNLITSRSCSGLLKTMPVENIGILFQRKTDSS